MGENKKCRPFGAATRAWEKRVCDQYLGARARQPPPAPPAPHVMAFFPPPTDVPTPSDAAAWETTILVISHIGLVVLVPWAFVIDQAYAATSALLVLIFSDVYHLCRGGWMCFGLTLDDARRIDHMTSMNAVCCLLLLIFVMGTSTSKATVAARTALPFVIVYAVMAYPFQTQSTVLILAALMLMVADHLLRDGRLRVPDASHIDRAALALGFLFTLVGLLLFTVLSSGGTYAVPHALWHLVITIAFYLVLVGVSRRRGDKPFWLVRCLRHVTRD
jgi:hypothetical protein